MFYAVLNCDSFLENLSNNLDFSSFILHQATEHHQWARAKTVLGFFFNNNNDEVQKHILNEGVPYVRKEKGTVDKSRRLVVAIATVVATPGPIPEVPAAVRLEARSEAAGSGAALDFSNHNFVTKLPNPGSLKLPTINCFLMREL
jgi:hypothetical protein